MREDIQAEYEANRKFKLQPDGSAIDWRGNRYTVGSRVLYPAMRGQVLEMNEGVITALFPTKTYRWEPNYKATIIVDNTTSYRVPTRAVTITRVDLITVI